MKKIISLLIAFGCFATAFSQSRKIDEAKDIINGRTTEQKKVYSENGSRYPTSTSGSEDVNSINKEYDRKINAVRANPFLSAAEKERRIRELENERNARIRAINGKGGSYSYNNKKYKSKGNNGKHLGWEKGVGNPHRTGNAVNHGKGNGKGKGKH